MARELFKKINWKYALGEIVLIFIGITIAIWFNNWNESRKEQKVEVKSLVEIKGAIAEDLRDIDENIAGFSKRVHLYRMIAKHIEHKLPMNDTLSDNLPYLQGVTTFLSNIGPYETLKSRGLEIISNDEIRMKVSLYYDLEYDRIQTNERQHYDHYNEYLKPAMIDNFDLSDPRLGPIDYDKLLNDFEFKQVIHWALRIDSYMLENYKMIEKKGETLLKDLEVELKRLE